MINLFEYAIKKNELLEFAMGAHEYFILDREYGGHWVLISWQNYILPYLAEIKEENRGKHIVSMLESLIESKKEYDIEKRIDALLYHLHVYYYYKKEGKIYLDSLANCMKKIETSLIAYITYLSNQDKEKLERILKAIEIIKRNGGLLHFAIELYKQ